jgi:predicted Zn-dependent peptidase
VLTASQEFAHKEVAGKVAAAAAVRKQATLENGVKVVANEKDSSIVNLKFAVLGGSSTETAAQKGAAHFLSVAAFAGNKHESGLKLVRFLESHGVNFSATADREKIVYDVSMMADKVEPALATVFNAIASAPHAQYVVSRPPFRVST